MFLQQIVNGITIGSTYALIAIGFSMVFSVLELVNLANGSMYMLGAYVTLFFLGVTGGNAILAILISLAVCGVISLLLERFSVRGLRKRNAPKLAGLISTMGMSIALDNAILLIYGGESKGFPNLLDFGKFNIGNVVVSWTQIIILVTACVLMTVLSVVVYKTKMGKAMRATAQNLEASRLMGININSVIAITFVIAGLLACISGSMYGMYYQSLDVGMGARIGIKIFASAILGGVGVLPGAVVGGLTIGIVETLVAGYISSGYRDTIAFIILIAVLLIKPAGLFGKQQINKV